MKKNYLVLLCSLFCVYSTAFSQARTNDHGDVQLPGTPGGVDYLGSCDTLVTTFVAGNGNSGSMFSLKAKQDIIIQNFEANLNGSSGIMKIYFRMGTYTGFAGNPAAWTLIDSAFTTSSGVDVPTLIPIQINMEVDSGETVSFYVTGTTGAGLFYTNGTTEGAVCAANTDLEIYEGLGLFYPFGSSTTPRIWNGIVNYCPNINYCDELITTFAGGNSNDGIVFEMSSLEDLVIRSFDVNLSDTGYAYIYYKSGAYVGTTTNPGAWTLADSVFIAEMPGINVPTEIPIELNLFIPQGQLYSFIITGNGIDQMGVEYTNGVAIGTPFATNASLVVREGEGFSGSWGGANGLPRRLNAIVHYCKPGPDTAVVCENLFTTNALGNSNSGIMFDVDAKQDAVEIQSFDTYFTNGGPQEVRVYYKNGTHVGFEDNASAWTLVDSMLVNVPAAGTLVHIPIPVNVQIAPNAKMAFFVYSAIDDLNYSNGVGTIPDTLFNEDSFIKFREGTGKSSIFTGANFNPRVFNGRINYCYLESWIGIEENTQLTGVEIWPNPTQGIFTISAFNTQENIEGIEVLNLNGQVVRQWTTLGGNSFSADISNEPAGVYLVKTLTQTATYTHKIILTGQ